MKISHLMIPSLAGGSRTARLFFILLSMIFLTACSSKRQQSEKPTLTVTLEPLRYFTETIAGDKFRVVSMVPKGSSPETYDPTPQQLVNLDKSIAYLRIGYIGFEQVWMDKLIANAPRLNVFDASEGIEVIREGEQEHGNNSDKHKPGNTGEHKHDNNSEQQHGNSGEHTGHHHHEGGIEPHIWNSARNASVIARNIYTALCELDGANEPYYRHRLDSLQQLIAQTDREVRDRLLHADTTFLIYHPALSYFARDYGLKQISIEEGGKEPSPAHLKELIETCRRDNARVIFVQQEFDTRNARLIADELGVTVVPVNPLSYEWREEMIKVADALAK